MILTKRSSNFGGLFIFRDHHIQFTIGVREIHVVSYHFNKMWGKTEVCVDNIPIKTGFRMVSFFSEVSGQNDLEFYVGVNEIHKVRIKIDSPLLFPLFLPKYYNIYIDDHLVDRINR